MSWLNLTTQKFNTKDHKICINYNYITWKYFEKYDYYKNIYILFCVECESDFHVKQVMGIQILNWIIQKMGEKWEKKASTTGKEDPQQNV